ncbi:MAG: NADP-dependent phosphogluconate dehydrogenase, partial [Chitinophagaceae bacterium]
AEVFKTGDALTPGDKDFLVDNILDKAGSKGTGKWTSQDAMDLPVAIPTIDMAVSMRDLSVYKEEREQAATLYQPTINPIKISNEALLADLEKALHFCFIMAYAQGLNMLAKASDALKMDIHLTDVVKVWRQGCIIRSVMLGDFYKAYQTTKGLTNLLLDADIAKLIKEDHQSIKNIVIMAVKSGVPLPGMMSALAYFEATCSERLPTNLIQAQRDNFGAHTYQRTDREGVFHTEWNA